MAMVQRKQNICLAWWTRPLSNIILLKLWDLCQYWIIGRHVIVYVLDAPRINCFKILSITQRASKARLLWSDNMYDAMMHSVYSVFWLNSICLSLLDLSLAWYSGFSKRVTSYLSSEGWMGMGLGLDPSHTAWSGWHMTRQTGHNK